MIIGRSLGCSQSNPKSSGVSSIFSRENRRKKSPAAHRNGRKTRRRKSASFFSRIDGVETVSAARPVGTTPIVAWHEVPGKESLEEPSRRVRYDRAQLIPEVFVPGYDRTVPPGHFEQALVRASPENAFFPLGTRCKTMQCVHLRLKALFGNVVII